jgi:single-stranded-DNA-specific exonuclease
MIKWSIGKPDSEAAREIATKGALPYAAAEVLTTRGIFDIKSAAAFFGGELSDPFLIKDMDKAVNIISDAIERDEKICVYGDYDCDGICSTAILTRYLETICADIIYHINLRDKGFGLSSDVIKELAKKGVNLIITVDNGTSALREAKLAKELGMKLVITDHHEPGEILPDALAIVNPHRKDDNSPFSDLCGCGVALKLIAALDGGDYSAALEQFSDLAALATVADVVPLYGENRAIAANGFHYMENSENEGLRALIRAAGMKNPPTSIKMGFIIGPRVNASGRFSSAEEAVKLFLTEDSEEAAQIAEKLCEINIARKKTEAEILENISEMINADPSLINGRVLTLCGENWHHGVIGVVASRLSEQFNKPCFIMSAEDGEIVRGSARSFPGFSVFEALEYCSDALTKYGGHTGAGGFSLKRENVPIFAKLLEEFARENLEITPSGIYEIPPRPVIQAIKRILPDEINLETLDALSVLEPFGEGNPEPEFLIQGAVLLSLTQTAKGVHTKAKFSYGSFKNEIMFFSKAPDEIGFVVGDKIDLLVSLEENIYNGNRKLQLKLKSARKSGIIQSKFLGGENAYYCYLRDEIPETAKEIFRSALPLKEECALVWHLIGAKSAAAEAIYQKIADKMNYFKFRMILDIFTEAGLAEFDYFEQTIVRANTINKTDLTKTQVYKKLKSLT